MSAPLAANTVRAFFGPLFNTVQLATSGAIMVGTVGNPSVEAWARKVVTDSLLKVGIANPPLSTLQALQSIGRLEGFYGKAKNPPEWEGSNNWGAVQCCTPKDGVCPENTFKGKDTLQGGKVYGVCFRSYATPELGCLDMINHAMKSKAAKEAFLKGDLVAIATAMYDAHYYGTPFKDRDKAIAYYVSAMQRNIEIIARNLGEKVAATVAIKPSTPGGSSLLMLLPIALGLALFKMGNASGAFTTNDVIQSALVQTQASMKAAEKAFTVLKPGPLLDQWEIFYKGWRQFYADNYNSYCFMGCAAIGDQIDKYNDDLKVMVNNLNKQVPGAYVGPQPGLQTDDGKKPFGGLTELAWPIAIIVGVSAVASVLRR